MPRLPKFKLQTAQEIIAKLGENADPLIVLLEISRNPDVPTVLRVQSATAALPFCYPRLESLAISGPEGKPLEPFMDVKLLMTADVQTRRQIEDAVILMAKLNNQQRGTVIDLPRIEADNQETQNNGEL